MKKIIIGVLVGSARKGSFSRTVAETLAGLMPPDFEMRILEIADMPLYNQDFDDEGKVPVTYTRFRDQVRECDGFLFVTPEHNRSVPALLKNALDVGSRPMASSVWRGKPGAIVSVSPGNFGGFGANHILRQTMAVLNVFMMQQPEAYVGNVRGMIDADGRITDEKSLGFLKKMAEGYADWVKRFL